MNGSQVLAGSFADGNVGKCGNELEPHPRQYHYTIATGHFLAFQYDIQA